jgi:hypothetical protein
MLGCSSPVAAGVPHRKLGSELVLGLKTIVD